MDITFEILEMPKNRDLHSLIRDTEGNLRIDLLGRTFFQEENIWLFEFALKVKHWLASVKQNQVSSFLFCSMDLEEEPTYALDYSEETQTFLARSAFQKFECTTPLPFKTVVEGFENFLNRFRPPFGSSLDI